MPDLPSVAQRYQAALRDFAATRSEATLQVAYELGREAIAAGWGVLDMIRVHQDAQIALFQESGTLASPGLAEAVRAANAFLAESLSPFEMTHRGFREAYATLRQSEARYRSLVDNAPYGISRCGPDGRFVTANPAMVRLLGYDAEEDLLRVDPASAIHRGSDPQEYQRLVAQFSQSGDRARVAEVRWSRQDGTPIQVRLTGRAIKGAGGHVEAVEIIAEDVTEQRALEQRLRLSQKMEAIGQLAGGIAHDFNNFITGITLCNHILARGMAEDDPRRRQVEEIDLAATRAALLTQQLLAFARRQVVQPRVLDLNRILASMTKLLRPLLGAEVQLATSISPEACTVHADPGQLEQVIMNLAVNARDAMSGGGTVSLETRRIEAGSGSRESHPVDLVPGSWVTLSVTDTGIGMDAATQARAFEPFFSTKEPSHGTGLGLSTVYGIVTQSGGQVHLKSAPGQGTTVTVYLPLAPERREAVVRTEPSPEPERGTGTILLAEDDEIVQHGVRRALEDIGYTVLAASSGEDALGLARAQPGSSIKLLITDLVMPGMGGRALAEHFVTLHPEGCVLYMSGYAGDAVARRGPSVPETQFLQKPFSAEALVNKVADVLRRKSTAQADVAS